MSSNNRFGDEPAGQDIAQAPWRPITTAPKDGRSVLAFGPLPGHNAREHGWCGMRDTKWIRDGWEWYEPIANRQHTWAPTHWMDMPVPRCT